MDNVVKAQLSPLCQLLCLRKLFDCCALSLIVPAAIVRH